MTNYNKEYEKLVASLVGQAPKVLLHSCCAPCSSSVLERLTEHFSVTVFYYNPNIEPEEEYIKRKEEEKRLIASLKSKHPISFLDCDYAHERFLCLSKGLEMEPEKGIRCHKCYYERMKKTAEKALEQGYDYFCTTLTLSPLKDSEVINKIGEVIQKEVGIPFLYSDFKKKNGYIRSIELSKKYGLYRQDYCGCIFSKRAREEQKNSKKINKVRYDG